MARKENWWSTPMASGTQPAESPWASAATAGDNLELGMAIVVGPPIIDTTLGVASNITGVCDIIGLTGGAGSSILGGTFVQPVAMSGTSHVYGGIFLGGLSNGIVYDCVIVDASSSGNFIYFYNGIVLSPITLSMTEILGGFFKRVNGVMATIRGGFFTVQFHNAMDPGIAGGIWLNSGTLIHNGYKITGTGANVDATSYDFNPATGYGLHTLDIPGQDVLGCGLL